MKRHLTKLAALLLAIPSIGLAAPASPQQDQWQPGGGLSQIALWPARLAIVQPELKGAEKTAISSRNFGGRPLIAIENVARPTMTIYPAKGRNTGVALLVFPGGGYQALAVDLEGSEMCDWATARGITCAVLKYRVPQTWWHDDCHCQRQPHPFLPLQDAERAMRLLRQRAPTLGIDPHKIGVVGFSAGGHLVTAIANATGRNYAAVDAADALSARPDFAMPVYPGHLWTGRGAELFAFDPIRADGPPTFIVQAEDDPVDDVRNAVSYFLGLRAKKVPAEMHLYAHGGHAFGLRPTAEPVTGWPALAETWLRTIGML
jgi:acetyl esterase/lipase